MSRERLTGLLLALMTLLIYLPLRQHGFSVYDDGDYIAQNQIVQNGLTWAGVKWAFTTTSASNWHPLTWLSHMLDCELFGLDAGAHHLVNVLFHAANAMLLFTLLLRLTGAKWAAAVTAALFAWHPLHVQSVAWASERKDVLSTFFGLLALLAYAKHVNVRDQRSEIRGQKSEVRGQRSLGHLPPSIFYLLSLACFTLGLLAKPMLVTLPFVLLLLDYWPLGRYLPALRFGATSPPSSGSNATSVPRSEPRSIQNARSCEVSTHPVFPSFLFPLPSSFVLVLWRLVLEKWPFLLLSIGSCVVTFLAQSTGHAVASLETFPASYRLENAMIAVSQYLLKMTWPADLAIIYPAAPLSGAMVALAGAALVMISTAVWLARRRSPYWLVGWLWFLGTLMPVIGLVQVGGTSMADRYTYIPSIGIFTAVVFGFYELAWARKLFPWLAALPLLACVILTERQLGCWRNSETVFRHTLAITRNNEIAHLNLGIALDQQDRWPEALSEFREALRLSPSHYRTRFEIGNMLVKMGQPAAALAEYQICLGQDPEIPALHNAAGVALATQGDDAAAHSQFTAAEKLDPHYPQPHLEWARACFQQGSNRQAVDELWAAAKVAPHDFHTLATVAHYLAATSDDASRDGASALALALKAGELSQNRQPEVFDALGMAFATTGDFSNAVVCAQNALVFLPPAKQKEFEAIQQRLKLYQNRQPWRESFTNALPP